jgi:sialic acid synthase SpsE
MEFKIGDKQIGGDAPPFVIAEAGSNFDQDIDTAYRLIDAAAIAGADAVKFQLFRATSFHPEGTKEHAAFRAVELNPEWVAPLSRHAAAHNLLFLASAFDPASVEVLEAADIAAHKVASSEATNLALLSLIAEKGRPVLLSTGMCDMVDIHEAVSLCLARGNEQLALLQCAAIYPLAPEHVNLRAMDLMARTFGCPVGFSDHTLGLAAAIAAVARGAAVIEKHFTLDKGSKGPDHFYALEPDELKRLVGNIHEAHAALGVPEKELLPQEREFGRREGLYAARDIAAGETIAAADIEIKRPALGLRARYRDTAIGTQARRAISAGAPIAWDDIGW